MHDFTVFFTKGIFLLVALLLLPACNLDHAPGETTKDPLDPRLAGSWIDLNEAGKGASADDVVTLAISPRGGGILHHGINKHTFEVFKTRTNLVDADFVVLKWLKEGNKAAPAKRSKYSVYRYVFDGPYLILRMLDTPPAATILNDKQMRAYLEQTWNTPEAWTVPAIYVRTSSPIVKKKEPLAADEGWYAELLKASESFRLIPGTPSESANVQLELNRNPVVIAGTRFDGFRFKSTHWMEVVIAHKNTGNVRAWDIMPIKGYTTGLRENDWFVLKNGPMNGAALVALRRESVKGEGVGKYNDHFVAWFSFRDDKPCIIDARVAVDNLGRNSKDDFSTWELTGAVGLGLDSLLNITAMGERMYIHAEMKGGIEASWTGSIDNVRVKSVEPGGAAASAGLQVGDQLLKINGRNPGYPVVAENLSRGDPGSMVELEILREGRPVKIKVRRGERRLFGTETTTELERKKRSQ